MTMDAMSRVREYQRELEKKSQTPGFTWDRSDFVRDVQAAEALLRGIPADFYRPVPDDLTACGETLPEEIRYAVTYVEERGWCLWATTVAGTDIAPRDRDWHPLGRITQWTRVGFAGVHVTLR